MSSVLGGLGSIAEKSAGEALAFGLGFALGRALEPAGVGLAQTAWDIDPNKVLGAGEAAQIVAEAVDALEWGEKEARQTGINKERFDLLVQEVLNAPGFGELVRMYRRGTINDAALEHGFRKNKLEGRWDTPLTELQHERLEPAVIAVSGQRGTMSDAGLLPVGPPTETGNVPPMPVSAIDPIEEAKASGVDRERLAVMMRNVGLPPGPGELLQLLNRGKITDVDFFRGIAEGNTRNEWAPFLLNLRRRLLTPHEYAELDLRGIIPTAARNSGAALSGMEPTDTQLLFELLGRPLNVHEITTAVARGGSYGGVYEGVPEPYLDAIRRSAIRPEYGNLAWHNRYTYPSAFVLRSLAQSGDLPPEEVEPTLLRIGWEPSFAAKVAVAWTGGKTAKADPHIGKAEGQLWTALHKAYVNSEAPAALARTTLAAVGVTPGALDGVLGLWDHERNLIRATLSAKEIKKAVGQPGKDQAWAMERLHELGYTSDDAATFLAE